MELLLPDGASHRAEFGRHRFRWSISARSFFRSTVKRSEPWTVSSEFKTLQISVVAVAIVLAAEAFLHCRSSTTVTNRTRRTTCCATQCNIPPRGEVYDRNGQLSGAEQGSLRSDGHPARDQTVRHSGDEPYTGRAASNRSARSSVKRATSRRRRASVIFKQLPKEVKLRLRGARLSRVSSPSTARCAPTRPKWQATCWATWARSTTASSSAIPYYRSGDYIGIAAGSSWLTKMCLRGEKGVKIEMVDVHGIPQRLAMRTACTIRCPRRAWRSPARSTAGCRRSPRS